MILTPTAIWILTISDLTGTSTDLPGVVGGPDHDRDHDHDLTEADIGVIEQGPSTIEEFN